jgi:nicotinamide-nucleotide amidase
MNVEIICIGTKWLMSDILETNTAYISQSLREAKAHVICKVTVGEDPEMITNVMRVALGRADMVLTTGGLDDNGDYVRQAIVEATGLERTNEAPGVTGGVTLGGNDAGAAGLLIETRGVTLICLPGNRRDMAYLLENEVMPRVRRRLPANMKVGWALLRTVDIMESSLKQELSDLVLSAGHRITYDSFAGQTNIQLWVEAETQEEIDKQLEQLKQEVFIRLGDHIYGEEKDRLEDQVLLSLAKGKQRLAVAECNTNDTLVQILNRTPYLEKMIRLLPAANCDELANSLEMEPMTEELDAATWCRMAAERLRHEMKTDLGLFIFKHITPGGIQVFVTLASPHGVSVTQRSFGGHPENINQWIYTLGLTHLRRWLLAHP